MPSVSAILSVQAVIIGLVLLFRDYREHKTGPPAWWRLWVKPVQVETTPAPSVPSSAGAAAAAGPPAPSVPSSAGAAAGPPPAAAVAGAATSGYYGKIDNTNAALVLMIAVLVFMLWNKK